MDSCAQRRRRLERLLKEEELHALLISNPFSVSYLTNFSGDSSYLILGRTRTLLVSDSRYTEQVAEECPGLETHIRPPGQKLPEAVAEVLGKLGFRTIGIESGYMTLAEAETLRDLLPAVEWKGKPDRVEQLRVIKDAGEIAEIRAAIDIAERAYAMFCAMLRPDDREKDLGDALESYIRRAGGRCSSFPSIVAVGARAALPHAPPTDRAVAADHAAGAPAEMGAVLVDWGASGRFYKSDLTRLLPTRKISPKLQKVYGVVSKAQEKAFRKVRPGVKAHDVDAEARAVIAGAGFDKFFGHGLGHGIGLQVHEAPAVRQNSEAILQAGMVFTVEPGIYLPQWGGIRLEDDVLVTPDGCEILTSVSKELQPIFE